MEELIAIIKEQQPEYVQYVCKGHDQYTIHYHGQHSITEDQLMELEELFLNVEFES